MLHECPRRAVAMVSTLEDTQGIVGPVVELDRQPGVD
jgi:hypothetical protein